MLCSFLSWSVNESYRSEFIELRKWLKERKFEDTDLVPASFPGESQGEGGCVIPGNTSVAVYWASYVTIGVCILSDCPKRGGLWKEMTKRKKKM